MDKIMDTQKLRDAGLHSAADELDQLRSFKAKLESQKPVGKVSGTFVGAYSIGNVFFPDDVPLPYGTELYTMPVPAGKPERITEQNARVICTEYNNFRMDGHGMTPSEIINKWLRSEGRELLNKLNEDRQVSDNVPAELTSQKAARITEQDAKQIANSVANSKCGSFWEWYESEGRTLLDRLNAHRQVPAVAVPDELIQWLTNFRKMTYNTGYLWMSKDAERFLAMLSASPTPSHKPTVTVPDGLVEALVESQYQVDADGTFIGVSRQALDEAIEIIRSLSTSTHSQQSARITSADQFIDGRYYWCKFTNRNAASCGETVIWKYSQNGRDAPFLAHHPVDAELFEKAEIYGPVPMLESYCDHCQSHESQQSSDTDRLREFADEVKQLCSDFSDRQNRPYMGDVTAAIDGLYEQFSRYQSRRIEQDAPIPWIPVLKNRADGVDGHYVIGRYNPSGYWEFWNLVAHKWASASDKVLSLDEANDLLRRLVLPSRESQQNSDVEGFKSIPVLPYGFDLRAYNQYTGEWVYLNHANTWQLFQGPIKQPHSQQNTVSETVTPEMEAAAEKYWNERRLKGLSDDPRTWAGVYAAMRAVAPITGDS